MRSLRVCVPAAVSALIALLVVLPLHAAEAVTTTSTAAATTTHAAPRTLAPRPADRAPAPHQRRARNYWGAISISSDHTFAYALDRGTKKRAIRDAQRKCKHLADYPRYCVKATWFANTCAAISYVTYPDRFIKKYRLGYGPTRPIAIKRAHKHLKGKDKILGYACTTRYRR